MGKMMTPPSYTTSIIYLCSTEQSFLRLNMWLNNMLLQCFPQWLLSSLHHMTGPSTAFSLKPHNYSPAASSCSKVTIWSMRPLPPIVGLSYFVLLTVSCGMLICSRVSSFWSSPAGLPAPLHHHAPLLSPAK